MSPEMRAGIYARISDDREETQAGVGRQVHDCQALAVKRGWSVADQYVDNDISAYKAVTRPEWERMLTDIQDDRLDAIIVYHLDRLTRQPRDLERFFDVCDRAGLRNMATVSGDIDLSTDDGRFHARIMGAVARKSSDDQSRRLKRKMLELAQTGKPTGGGDRPFGYEDDRITIRPDEAVVLREIVQRFLAGETIRGLCSDLNRRGVKTTRGNAWQTQVLRRLIARPRISGQREHHGEIIGPAVWPAIVTPEETARVRAILADPARRAVRPPRAYMLKGLVRCSRCNAVLVGRPREDGARRYVCATGPNFLGCGGAFALSEPLERYVAGAALTVLDSPAVKAAVEQRPAGDGNEWQTRADQIAAKLDELATAYSQDAIGMREWLTAREPLQQQLEEAQRRLARAAGKLVLASLAGRGSEIAKEWDSYEVDRQRTVISSVLFHVIVRPGIRGLNKFDPSRFDLIWRH